MKGSCVFGVEEGVKEGVEKGVEEGVEEGGGNKPKMINQTQ